MVFNILQLGKISYRDALALQEQMIARRKAGEIGDTLLLQEHPPVITLGKNARAENIVASREQIAARGIEIFDVNRGGDVTYHGPGQLVGYPIFDLRDFRNDEGERKTLGPVDFMRRMEEVIIRTCADFGIATRRVPGLTGVWTTGDKPAKICAMGIHVSRGVTSHGFALNISAALDPFELIVPCGITDKPVTSMEKLLGPSERLNMQAVSESVARNFGRVFNREILWLDSLDDLQSAPANQDTPAATPSELRRLHNEEDLFLA